MSLKVRMSPDLATVQAGGGSGIRTVVEQYYRHLPAFDIELVGPQADSFDVLAIHASAYHGFRPNDPIVAHCHGLHWTADNPSEKWEDDTNGEVIEVLRHALTVTVPSRWVAQTIARDMHFWPQIIPHGVEWGDWQGGEDRGYILWNKNRPYDACSPTAVNELARRRPQSLFLSTFADRNPPTNVKTTGAVDPQVMRTMVLGASVYLATAKETFGIATLEAMAAGIPVLGFDHGGTADLIKHGRTGYLAHPGDYDDLAVGLDYCLKHRQVLGRNAARAARDYTWESTCKLVSLQYARTVNLSHKPIRVAVIIPCFNKASTLERALRSVINQTRPVHRIIIVNNNSTDDFGKVILNFSGAVEIVNCPEQGVAHARNYGIALAADCDYICCLDADDEIKPRFIEVTLDALLDDNALAIAYTKLEAVAPDGTRTLSAWPSDYRYNEFLEGYNQCPTCCLFRRTFWDRLGGFRQRYAPGGAGAEDCDFWFRIGAAGGNAKLVSEEAHFIYYLGGIVSGNPNYREVDWRADKPWVQDKQHPFASVATPANGMAHPVRQYDEPAVTVVVPCGPDHIQYLWDALDSVESQTFRKWECIVVFDGDPDPWAEWSRLRHAFPAVKFKITARPRSGSGVARNNGAELARAPLLLYLDADDWLAPNCLEVMLSAYAENPGSIIYSDYLGYAYLADHKEVAQLDRAKRLVSYDAQSMQAVIRYNAANYRCEDAQAQPIAGSDPYIWNVVSSLVPRQYHLDVAGFDEMMESWEDWDYWIQMARLGHCFVRVAEPLLNYRFYSGTRRQSANPGESGDSGRQLSSRLLTYMAEKNKRSPAMPCRSCGSGRSTPPPAPQYAFRNLNEGRMPKMSSEDMVKVRLIDGNIGEHLIAFNQVSYGYRSHGDEFTMQASHAKLDRRVIILDNTAPAAAAAAQPKSAPQPPLPPPDEVAEPWPMPKGGAAEITHPHGLPDSNSTPSSQGEVSPMGLGAASPGVRGPIGKPGVEGEEGRGPRRDAPETMDVTTSDGRVVERVALKSQPSVFAQPAPTPAPAPAKGETVIEPKIYNFASLWGIDDNKAEALVANGVRTLNGLILLGPDRLAKVLTVSDNTARNILSRAEKLIVK